jgi:hypothetical protein
MGLWWWVEVEVEVNTEVSTTCTDLDCNYLTAGFTVNLTSSTNDNKGGTVSA